MTATVPGRAGVASPKRAFVALALLASFAPPSLAQETEDDAVDPFVAFARQIEDTVAAFDPTFMDASFDLDAFFGFVTAGVDESAFGRTFVAGAREAFEFATTIVASNAQYDGTYRFLRMLPGEPVRALFRHAGDDGLNYHELYLRRDDDGAIAIIDVMPYATGRRFSATLRASYLNALATQDRSLVDRLLRSDPYTLEDFLRIGEVVNKLESDPEGALEVSEELHETLRQGTMVQMLRVQAAASVSDEAHLAALSEFKSLHPDFPGLTLILIDYHLLRGEHAEALAYVDRVDAMVLGDPFLDVLRGRICLLANETDEARAAAERALERDPSLGYEVAWLSLDIALTTRDHATTLAFLVALEDEHGIEWSDLTTVDSFAAFVGSPEHETWLARFDAAPVDDE